MQTPGVNEGQLAFVNVSTMPNPMQQDYLAITENLVDDSIVANPQFE
jgi:hypothetical protein